MGKKVIITGVPGVGKTTVVNEALKKLKEQGVEYQSINFGTFMFEVAKNDNIVAGPGPDAHARPRSPEKTAAAGCSGNSARYQEMS